MNPSPNGIDAWAQLGNDSWSWNIMEPYYRKFFTLNLPDEATSDYVAQDWTTAICGEVGGPVQVSNTEVTEGSLSKTWIATFRGLNHGAIEDAYLRSSISVHTSAATVDPSSKTQSYAATAYYAPVAQRANLTVLTGAEVEKIGFTSESDDKVANVVYFSQNGMSTKITVRKEVILAAGTFHSPKLLELCGNPQI